MSVQQEMIPLDAISLRFHCQSFHLVLSSSSSMFPACLHPACRTPRLVHHALIDRAVVFFVCVSR